MSGNTLGLAAVHGRTSACAMHTEGLSGLWANARRMEFTTSACDMTCKGTECMHVSWASRPRCDIPPICARRRWQ